MNITFINKSDKAVHITYGDASEIIARGEKKTVFVDAAISSFAAEPDEASYVTYILAKFGVVLKRHLKLKCEYEFTPSDNMEIVLLTDKRKGKYMDEYEKVVPKSKGCSFPLVSCRVPDESRIKKELEAANKRGDNTLKIFDVFDILGNALTGLLLLVIPFILIWIFGDIHLAVKICGMAFIPMFGIIILLNRYMDKLKRKIWRKAKDMKLKNEIFKDYNSYFDSEYIASVFKR